MENGLVLVLQLALRIRVQQPIKRRSTGKTERTILMRDSVRHDLGGAKAILYSPT